MTIDAASTFYLHREGPGVLFGMSYRRETARLPRGLQRGLAAGPRSRRWSGAHPRCSTSAWRTAGPGSTRSTPDHNALIGEAHEISRFLYATGFSGHGFLQGPAVGEVVRDLYLGREPVVDVSSLSARAVRDRHLGPRARARLTGHGSRRPRRPDARPRRPARPARPPPRGAAPSRSLGGRPHGGAPHLAARPRPAISATDEAALRAAARRPCSAARAARSPRVSTCSPTSRWRTSSTATTRAISPACPGPPVTSPCSVSGSPPGCRRSRRRGAAAPAPPRSSSSRSTGCATRSAWHRTARACCSLGGSMASTTALVVARARARQRRALPVRPDPLVAAAQRARPGLATPSRCASLPTDAAPPLGPGHAARRSAVRPRRRTVAADRRRHRGNHQHRRGRRPRRHRRRLRASTGCGCTSTAPTVARRAGTGRNGIRALERADSFVLDPHKWLFQPYDVACVWVARPGGALPHLRHAPGIPSRLRRAAVDLHNRSLELTRRARGAKLWLTLRTYGLDRLVDAVQRGIALAEHAELVVAADEPGSRS